MSPTSSSRRPTPVSATYPYGRTARRLEWSFLPPSLRTGIERRLGSPVVSAHSAGGGFTPGFASVLVCADGSRHFVKAASKKAQRPFADTYREEARKVRCLPRDLPIPHLLWSHEDDLWVVLELEYVDGQIPARPWVAAELDACLDTLEVLAARLTPPPMPLNAFADEFAQFPAAWDEVRRVSSDLPHLDDAAALAARFGDATRGESMAHIDARDDNFIISGDRALLCDWNWPMLGAPWLDTVSLLISAHGDGLDADAMLRTRELTRTVPADDVDAFLALLAGYFLKHRALPAPSSSPHLRAHQSWWAEATWSWLGTRRGWT